MNQAIFILHPSAFILQRFQYTGEP